MRVELLCMVALFSGCHIVLGLEKNEVVDDAAPEADAEPDAAPGCWTTLRQDHDEDGDGRMDGCDNCPASPNPNQTDDDGDGVGNVCDPRQTSPHRIAMFRSFHVEADRLGFTAGGDGTWSTFQDALVLNVPASATLISNARFQGAVVTARFASPSMAATTTEVGLYASHAGSEYLTCFVRRDAAGTAAHFERHVENMNMTTSNPTVIGNSIGMELLVSAPSVMTPRCALDTIDDTVLPLSTTGPLDGSVGIFATDSAVAVEYLLVIVPK